MKITGIRYAHVKGAVHYEGPLGEDRLVQPIDIYPEYRARPGTWPVGDQSGPDYSVQWRFLFIDTDVGISGTWMPITERQAYIIEHELSPILIGEDPRATERIWDKMYRNAIHGRKGETMMSISAVDLALWDFKGKLHGVPVYQLLGGPSRDKIRAYASMLGHSSDPELVGERSRQVAELGYTACKWFFRDGPADGPAGIDRNLGMIRSAREAVGPDVELMFDAWSSWNVPYTQRMAALAAQYRPWWFEEPVLADMIPQYAELVRTVSTVSISGGEHEYTRWGAKALLDARAVDVLQVDPTWAGGITEMVKICALASAYGIPVVPHHGGQASRHLIASQPLTTCPIEEWLIQYGVVNQALLRNKFEPQDGFIALPKAPGLGMEIDYEAVESYREFVV